MRNAFFDKIIEVNSYDVIYIGGIERIFQEVTGNSLPENYAVSAPFDIFTDSSGFFSESEIKCILKFRTMKKQAEWISGRYLIKNALILKHPDKKFSAIEVSYHDEGAPFLKLFPEYSISVSHSGRYTALMLCTEKRNTAAVDMEEIVLKNTGNIMKIAFTENEIEQMNKNINMNPVLELTEGLNKFYEVWTGKEAYLKYIGRGFHEPLKNIEIINNQILYKGIRQKLSLVSVIFDNHFISYIKSD
ncbi:MAG: 4'-phosphopantetheinyl transferase superfamily protein [Spirochaetes bacterium]|nr:4'-phosphopantetheinyl transferase superfamily protein [Spirochaetota bacterium]